MNRRLAWSMAMGLALSTAAFAAACGDSGGSSQFGGDDQDSSMPGDDGALPFGDAAAPDANDALVVDPADSTIDVPPTTTLQLRAYAASDTTKPLVATWSIDAPAIGSIDANGVFTANGDVGGVVTVFAQVGPRAGHASITVRVHVADVPAGFDPGVLGALRGGGTADANFKWLYPYDQTVFPRGLNPPRLQFTSAAPQWLYVTAKSQYLDFAGVYAATNADNLPGNPAQLELSAKAWRAITLSAAAKDPVAIGVTKYAAGAVTGPIKETWTVAQGALKGVVYYDSYDSPLAQGDAGTQNDMGAVLRLEPGASQPEVFLGGAQKGSCTVCHTLSANGQTMAVSAGHQYDAIYGVAQDGGAPVGPRTEAPDNVLAFGALTPDGKYLLSCGSSGIDAGYDDAGAPTIDDYGPNVVSMTHELSSQLFDTSDGGTVVASLPGVPKALMPAFSPDGKQLVFNRFVAGQDQRLAVMPFDEGSHAFGTFTDVFVDPGYFLAWPSFLPDSQGFVFQTSDSSDQYSTYDPVSYDDANGELFVYVPSIKDVHHLRAAMGVDEASGATFVLNPNGSIATQDTTKNYEPTALPVASGGYYWVVFTSRRSYGNTIDNSDPNAPPPDSPKKLWVTAIDIGGDPQKDPSHPAFYLPGQELAAGNLRGFWSLEPCRADGADCQSGTDCCNGFCRQVTSDGGTAFACVPPPASCANEDEKCTTTADCCAPPSTADVECINGFCAHVTPK